MRCYIDVDDLEVLVLRHPTGQFGVATEIPNDLVERYKAADKEFTDVQQELHKILGEELYVKRQETLKDE
jgi:hypothetical protein